MNTENTTNVITRNYKDYLQSLERACSWAEIPRGRAVKYVKLIRKFFKEDNRSREHILAYNESCEITDIFEFWESHVSHFPGIKDKIKKCLKKGPTLREDENPNESTNRPRNDAFVFLLAGNLMRANIKVIAVDGVVEQGTSCNKEADITFEWNGAVIDIECKRPQTERAIEERLEEALKQLTGPNRQEQLGIIAIDCSAFIRPPGKLIERDSAESAERHISKLLERKIMPKVNKYLEPNILGYLLFARVPGMTRKRLSPILSPQGMPYTNYRPDSISSILCIRNSSSSNPEIIRSICEMLHHDHK